MTLNLHHKKNADVWAYHAIRKVINYRFNIDTEKVIL